MKISRNSGGFDFEIWPSDFKTDKLQFSLHVDLRWWWTLARNQAFPS